MKAFGCLAVVAALLLMATSLSAQSLDTSVLDDLIPDAVKAAPQVDQPAELDLSVLDDLAKPMPMAHALNLSVLDGLDKPQGCKCPAGCLCVGDQCLCPQKAFSAASPQSPLAAEGWYAHVWMPTWCGYCKTMRDVQGPRLKAAGLPCEWTEGDEQKFPADVIKSASRGWPLVQIRNSKTGAKWDLWGSKTVEQIEEFIAWAKLYGEAWKAFNATPPVAPPQSAAPVLRYYTPAPTTTLFPIFNKPARCANGRCSQADEDSPLAWV